MRNLVPSLLVGLGIFLFEFTGNKWSEAMKRLAGLLIGLFLGLPLAAVAVAETPGAKGATAPFLYVMVAKQGKVIEGDNGDYTLVVAKGDIDHVIEISEKPFKMGNFISRDRIVKTWKTGAGNFGKGITMKGTFMAGGEAIASVNIKSISKTDADMRFVFSQDGGAPLDLQKFGTLQALTTVNYCCHPEGGSAE